MSNIRFLPWEVAADLMCLQSNFTDCEPGDLLYGLIRKANPPISDDAYAEWLASIEPEFDSRDDFEKSLALAFQVIRERTAAGGKTWVPGATLKDPA